MLLFLYNNIISIYRLFRWLSRTVFIVHTCPPDLCGRKTFHGTVRDGSVIIYTMYVYYMYMYACMYVCIYIIYMSGERGDSAAEDWLARARFSLNGPTLA